jgi:Coenzyme PQQ synthesis protein D (PqqD)
VTICSQAGTVGRMPVIEPATVLVHRPDLLTAVVDGETVMLDPRQGCYFGLDRGGSAIWELLAEPRSVADVCAALLERYAVSAEECRSEVLFFLHELYDAGLVEARADKD